MPPAPSLTALHRELGIPRDYAATRHLPRQEEADEIDLIEVGTNEDGRPIRLVRPAADAWLRMSRAAAHDDIELVPISGFRSIARQTVIIREKIAAGQPIDAILRYVAAPGYSEHHTGRALDIGSPENISLEEAFEQTPAYQWLAQRAGEFGYTLTYPRNNPYAIGYEPWHWCWREAAISIR